MRVKERVQDDTVVIRMTGDVMGGDKLEAFSRRIAELKEEGKNKVVVDLGGLRLINSVGIGTLVGCKTMLKEAGGDMKLANLSERAETMVAVVGLTAVFDITTTVDEAITRFAARTQPA